MTSGQSKSESAISQPARRRWLRWVLVLLLLAVIPLVIVGSVIAYEVFRPLPRLETQPPLSSTSVFNDTIRQSSSHNWQSSALATTQSLADNTNLTSAASASILPSWPPIVVDSKAPQSLRDQFARLNAELESCRMAFIAYTTAAPRLNRIASYMRYQELDEIIERADEIKDHIRGGEYPADFKADPLIEAGRRITVLRKMRDLAHLDWAIRHGEWVYAGNLLSDKFNDWDRAVYYWRRSGKAGYYEIVSRSWERIESRLGQAFGKPVKLYYEDLLEVNF